MFCIDYRKLNDDAVRDSYPIPRMSKYIECFGDAKVFIAMEANCRYWQVEIGPKERKKD